MSHWEGNWLLPSVLKTGVGKPIVSSNLTGPARYQRQKRLPWRFFYVRRLEKPFTQAFSALHIFCAGLKNADESAWCGACQVQAHKLIHRFRG